MANIKYCKAYRKTHYYLPIFGININITFNKKEWIFLADKYQGYTLDRELSDNGECFQNPHNSELIIGIFNNELSTVSHELIHAVLFILECKHIDPRESYGETMAYITAHLFDVIKERMSDANNT